MSDTYYQKQIKEAIVKLQQDVAEMRDRMPSRRDMLAISLIPIVAEKLKKETIGDMAKELKLASYNDFDWGTHFPILLSRRIYRMADQMIEIDAIRLGH